METGAGVAGGTGSDPLAEGYDTPDAALDAYGKALVDGDMPAFRRIAAKDSRAVAGMEAIIQMQKDKSPEEAAKINLQALAPHPGFGDAVSKDVKRGDTIGVDFDIAASVKPGSTVDFVLDPKAAVGYDSTLLEATIEATGRSTDAGTTLVDTSEEPGLEQESGTLSGTAVYFPDEQTIVSTSEQWLRNLISGPSAQTPLTEKLSQVDLDHDLIGVVVLDGIQDQAAGLLGMMAQETGSNELAGLAAMPRHMRSAVATFDLPGDSLLRLTLEAPDATSSTQLRGGAQNLIGILRGLRDVLPPKMPDATANPLLSLFDDLVGGVAIREGEMCVVVDFKSPAALADFIRNDAEAVVGIVASGAMEPNPDISSTGEPDPPVDPSKTETHLPPAKPAPGTAGGAMEIVDRNVEPGRFQPLLLRHPVDRMVLSEDARYLAAAHREADSISVIDVQSLDLVTTIDTPAPRAILWRGDHLFAANEGLGTISMFSESGQWKKEKSITTGDPNPEFMSAPGGRNYRGVMAVRCRGNGRDALPVVIMNVNSGRGAVFNNGRTSAANVDYGGKVMIVQSRAGSPNRYIAGVYNFAAVSQGRATPSMGEYVDSFPLLYQVGATPYWFGGRQVFTGMPIKAVIEAERLLVADRVIDVCYTFKTDQMRCIGLDSQRTVHTVRLPAFEVPSFFTKIDRAATVSKALEPAREETEPDGPTTGRPIKRTWTDSSGQFQIEAELVEVKDGVVTLKRSDGNVAALPINKLSQADQDYLQQMEGSAPSEPQAPIQWENFASKEAGFSADFPGKPDHIKEGDEDTGITHTYSATQPGTDINYTVMYDELDEDSVAAGPKAIFEGVVESLGEMTTSKKEIKIGNHPGMEFLLEFEEDGTPLVIRNRVYVVGNRLFQVMAAASEDEKQLAQFDRFLDSFKVLADAAPETVEPPDESEVSGRAYTLTGRSRWPSILERSQATATRDGLTVGRNYVRTKQGHFLTRDFRFEAVFGIKDGDSIVFVGIGEGRGGGPYKEPANSVHLRIHHESLKSGVGLAKGGQVIGTLRVGPDLPTGVHRAIITKEGDAVTFAIDVDNDGPTDDDMERTVSNIKEFAPELNSKNTHLFFGGGGAFMEIKLTYDPVPADKAVLPPTEPDPAAKAKVMETPAVRPEVALFNGRDLTGWEFIPVKHSKSKINKTWVVEPQRNVLVSLGGDDYNELATVGVYGDFKLGLEWRFRPGGAVGPNGSGIVVRGGGLTKIGLDPIGIEIDLRPGKDIARHIGTGCLIAYATPARNHSGATDGITNRQLGGIREPQLRGGGGWNECVITCAGDRLTVEMNGVVVNQASGIQVPKGRVYLRNQKTAVEFRNIRLLDLTPSGSSSRMLLNPSSSVAAGPAGSTSATSVSGLASPQRVALTELNTPQTDGYPWVSPDALALYWTREGGKQHVNCSSAQSRRPRATTGTRMSSSDSRSIEVYAGRDTTSMLLTTRATPATPLAASCATCFS